MTAADPKEKQLQFVAFCSTLDAGFWHQLTRNKLDVYKLDDKPRSIYGFYYNGDAVGLPCRMSLEFTSFNEVPSVPPNCFLSHGVLHNMNTIDAFKTSDKKFLLEQAASQLWNDIIKGNAIKDPSLLSRFMVLTFSDLKKYHYYYWFAFPALVAPDNVILTKPAQTLDKYFTAKEIDEFLCAYSQFIKNSNSPGFFLVKVDGDNIAVTNFTDFEDACKDRKVIVGFCDPSTMDSYPGWPLRNLLTLVAYHWADKVDEVIVVCFRNRARDGKREINHSLVLHLNVPSIASTAECPKSVGWEKNQRQKLGPRMVNLSSSMDPTRLAESSVDLNLKLMRWRLLPSLDLDGIAQTKCLLLGSGTLGCNVARCLLGWGIRTITFVDNSRVSYSNPVRQTLFEFEDCLEGGKPKAAAAAEKLKKIFPGVNSSGHELSIPMPGHPVNTTEATLAQAKKDVSRLEQLIDDHDVVFLLMDTRESRWLPTLVGASKRKIVINAALGFDTFMVVRHGLKLPKGGAAQKPEVAKKTTSPESPASDETKPNTVIPGSELGCYFCNDVVAPGNSTKDRTLDQQCTVTRPGISMMTGALAVELLITLLQHPDGGYAPADTSSKDDHLSSEFVSPLGLVPHQIRGFLSRFNHVLPASLAFHLCTACSEHVLQEYEKRGFEFLLDAFNNPTYLEDLTGLTELQKETQDAEIWDFSDDESVHSME
ncbi:ubiquitin-like modifier-activating enzyme ATG7 [Ptychodera flava]|uniref:ubiquitin-like modifier-activating enzyme ATG7 n=1 Tax=Ptychodera flava TaxID=63121 RepID=UPI00396AA85A